MRSTVGLQLTVSCFKGFGLFPRYFSCLVVVVCILFFLFISFECMAVSVLASLVCLPEGPVVILYT